MTGLFWHPLYSLSILWIRRPQQASPKVRSGRLKVEPAGVGIECWRWKAEAELAARKLADSYLWGKK